MTTHFTITITDPEDGTNDWVITRDIRCAPEQLCELATQAADEVRRIHDEHHVNTHRAS